MFSGLQGVEIPINDRLIPADKRTRDGPILGQNSFRHRAIPDWNSLPVATIESVTVAAFKSHPVD